MKHYLKQQRIKFKLTKAEAAEKLGITSDLLNSWEDGLTIPEEKHFDKIIDVYKLTEQQILNKIQQVLSKDNDTIFSDELRKNKKFIDRSICLDEIELDLNALDIRILTSIYLTASLGSNPYNALSKIITDEMELYANILRLVSCNLIEYDKSKGFLYISEFGSIVFFIIHKENLYEGVCFRQKSTSE